MLNGSPSSQKGGAAAARKAQFDPFQGMATYGQRYLKKTRTLPKLGGRPYGMYTLNLPFLVSPSSHTTPPSGSPSPSYFLLSLFLLDFIA